MIYNVVGMWNEFAFANTFLNDIRVKTLPLALGAFKGEHSQDTPADPDGADAVSAANDYPVYYLPGQAG